MMLSIMIGPAGNLWYPKIRSHLAPARWSASTFKHCKIVLEKTKSGFCHCNYWIIFEKLFFFLHLKINGFNIPSVPYPSASSIGPAGTFA
jgi:hypothetical protein